MMLSKTLKNEEGVALVTSLMLTFLALTVTMTAMYLMTVGTKQTGTTKRYRTALQAAYGSSDLILKDLIPQVLTKMDSATLVSDVTNSFFGVSNLQIGPDYSSTTQAATCIEKKMQLPTNQWPPECSATLKPKELPDFKFTMPASSQATPYTIYSKIVDTVVGNSDMSGVSLLGAGVAEPEVGIRPQHIPYVFRVEVQAEASGHETSTTTENASLSVLYSY